MNGQNQSEDLLSDYQRAIIRLCASCEAAQSQAEKAAPILLNFTRRLLNPEDLGWAVTPEVRTEARRVISKALEAAE